MKVQYNYDARRTCDGTLEPDYDTERALLTAVTDDERRAVIQPLVIAHAEHEADFVYTSTIDFCVE